MAASISTKTKSIGAFLKKASEHLVGGTGDYISTVMPSTTSTISGARAAMTELATIPSNVSSIVSKSNQLRNQSIFKKLSNWFMEESDNYNDIDTAGLSFDVPDDDSSTPELMETEISEWNKNANQISKSVVESSHKLFEAQISSTANMVAAIDKQAAIISSGFDKTHSLLEQILETLSKNTSTMIEAVVASSGSTQDNQLPFNSSGKFSLEKYKKTIESNIYNSRFGGEYAFLQMMLGMKDQTDPKKFVQLGLQHMFGKFAPNMEKNMKALDESVRDVITDSLIRIGENKNASGAKGLLAQLFGIDSSRTEQSTSRSELELKSVAFDSITKESIVGAIPGYLRHILTALGGPDLIYDFKSRTFKSQGAIRRDFHENAIAGRVATLYSANSNIQKALNKNDMSSMLYDLMMNDLGNKSSSGEARKIISSFDNSKSAEEYVLKTLLGRTRLNSQDRKDAKEFANALKDAVSGTGRQAMLSQANRANITRNEQLAQTLQEADLFGIDLSFIKDTDSFDKQAILEAYGKSAGKSTIRTNDPRIRLSGTNYTNMALYEIYRRLNEGINVFQVGKGKFRLGPYERFADDVLPKPVDHKPKQVKNTNSTSTIGGSKLYHDDGSANLLENQQNDDGTTENLSAGERLQRWGKLRGGNLAKAMFSGSPEQVKEAFGLVIRDLTDTSRIYIKKGLGRINDSFGNVTGFMKHKLFGSAYSYDSGKTDKDGNPVMVNIKQNSAGGLFGFVTSNIKDMFKGTKDRAFKWFKDVAGYFDYRGKGSSSGVENKRRKFLVSSIGAYAGAGLLGGPIGMLAGAIGANALDASGIGESLKGFLFGKDYTDKDGNIRHKQGIVGKVVDGIIDPFRYQLGKTFNAFSKTLKKNILGPLSDLGFAIKERITSTIADAAKTRFGKVFSFIGRMIMAPFKGALNLAKFPIHMLGAITRGTMGAAGSTFGGVTGALSSIIAGSTKYDENGNIIGGRGAVSERRKKRNAQIEEDYKNSEYAGGFNAWRAKQQDKRSKLTTELRDALAEAQAEDTAAISESNKKIEESSEKTANAIENMNKLASEKGSLYTHDHGLHERIDAILSHLGIKIPGTNRVLSKAFQKDIKNQPDGKRGFVDSLVGATATLVSGDETVSNDEARIATGLIEEGSKDKPNSSSMLSKLKNIMGMQAKRREEKGEKKGIFDTIADFIKDKIGTIGPLLLGAAAAFTAFSDRAQQAIGSILGKLGTGFDNFFSWLFNRKGSDPDSGGIHNLFMSPFDMRTPSMANLAIPFTSIYHTEKDAAGNDIHNLAAENSRNALFREWGTQSTIRRMRYAGHQYDMNRYMDQAINFDEKAKALRASGKTFDAKLAQRYSNKALDRAAHFESKMNGANTSGFSERNALKLQGGIAGIAGGGMAGGYIGGKISRAALDALGIEGPIADVGENIGTAYGTVKGASAVTKMGARVAVGAEATNSKAVNMFIDKMKEYLGKAGERLAQMKPFKKAAPAIKKMLGGVMEKFTERMLLPLAGQIIKALAKTGINISTGVATAGIATAAIAITGGIIQFFQTENLFGVGPDKADVKMRLIAGSLGSAFNLPYAPLLEVFDPLFSVVTNGEVPSFRSWVAINLYRAIASDEDVAEFEQNRDQMKEAVAKYNEKYGTKLDVATYNDMTNPSAISKLWKGTVLTDENGEAQFTEEGAVRRSGGLQSIIFDMIGKEVKKDENGNAIIGSDGLEEREDFDPVKFIMTPVMWPFRLLGKVKDGIVNWIEKESPWAKEGMSIPFWAGAQIGKIPVKLGEFFTETKDGAYNWYTNESPWGQEGMGPAEYAISKIRSIPEKLGEFFTETKDSVENWFKSESPWQKEGKSIGAWVLDKIAYPFKILKEKTDEFINEIKNMSLKDLIAKGISSVGDYVKDSYVGRKVSSIYNSAQETYDEFKRGYNSTSNKKGSGGGLDELSRGTGISPLSQDAVITSDFGTREHPVFGGISNHRGIDIAPKNGSSADALATFPGRITDIGFQKGGAGNYVTYQADNGLTVKYMHLADNSIPSGMQKGSRVAPGAKIGGMGSTGASTGPHLHYQLEQNGVPIDPSQYMDGTIHAPNARLAGSDITGDDILNEGTKWLGTPYVLGAADDATDATDCGKFTRDVCTKLGINVNSRLADVQYEMFEKAGAAIDVKDLQPGDFVFFENTYGNYPPGDITHVGFYAGNGYALHAGSSKGVSFVPLTAMNYGQRGGSIQKLWNIAPGKGVDANMQVGAGTGGRYNGSGGSAGKIGGGGGKKASGPLGQLLDSLKGAGSMFLNKVSGGLFGSEESSSGGGSSGGGGSNVSASFTGMKGNSNAEKIYNFLTGRGLSPAAAAGVMGNLSQESGFNPEAVEDGGSGPGHGIAQWSFGRWDNLQNYAAQNNKPWTDLELQSNLLWEELNSSDTDQRLSGAIAPGNFDGTGYGPVPGGFSGFKALDDPLHAAAAFEAAFERAGVPRMENRFAAAKEAMEAFANKGAGGPIVDPMTSFIDTTGEASGSMAIGKSVVSDPKKRKRGKGGGLDEIFSSIGKSVNKGARKLANSALDQFFGTSEDETSRYYVNVNPNSPNAGEITEGASTGISGNTERVEALLSQVVAELQAINGNTSTSSSLLNSLNQKDFVDHGVRESIKALGSASKNQSKPIPSRGNTRAIQNIIRP